MSAAPHTVSARNAAPGLPAHGQHRRRWVALGLLGALPWAGISHATEPAPLSVQVLDAAGQPVPGVVVAVRRVDAPTPTPAPLAQVEITQQGMRFIPAVSIVTPGTRIRLTNRDRFDHHVRGFQGQSFEYRIAGTGEAGAPPREGPEVVIQGGAGPVQLGCHIHSRMQAHIYVADTPWFGLSDATGRLTLPSVPTGAVSVQLWHPQQLLEQPAVPVRHTAAAGVPTIQRVALNFTPWARR